MTSRVKMRAAHVALVLIFASSCSETQNSSPPTTLLTWGAATELPGGFNLSTTPSLISGSAPEAGGSRNGDEWTSATVSYGRLDDGYSFIWAAAGYAPTLGGSTQGEMRLVTGRQVTTHVAGGIYWIQWEQDGYVVVVEGRQRPTAEVERVAASTSFDPPSATRDLPG